MEDKSFIPGLANPNVTQAEVENLEAQVSANQKAISVLNADKSTDGSVDSKIAAAEKEIIDDAADEYNSLGKIQTKISNLSIEITDIDKDVGANADAINSLKEQIAAVESSLTGKLSYEIDKTDSGVNLIFD